MRIYTVKLRIPVRPIFATATIRYRDASWPEEVNWTGYQKEFRLANGNPISLLASMDRLEEVVAHQAGQCGAEFTITHDGGVAPMREDDLVGGEEN